MNSIKTLNSLIEEIDNLISNNVTVHSVQFQKWITKTDRFIRNQFGDGIEYIKWCGHKFEDGELPFDQSDECTYELELVKAELEIYLEELQTEEPTIQQNELINHSIDKTKVFIVHGHDGELKEAVARVVEKQDIEAIILSEKTNQGKTIIEKLEKYSDVGAAILLFTNDDVGKGNNENDYHPRARQNVVLEAGYFIGKLGREHVVMLADSDNEIPGDLSGMVYTKSSNWKGELAKELEEMGFSIDYKKLFD